MASISLNHIKKVYPGDIEVISDLNLQIKDKEFVVLVGPSGCGKSTTLRMIAGLEEISDGEMYIGDRKVNDVAPKDRDIAMVFQNYALYPHMTVAENMAFPLKLRKVPKEEIAQRVAQAANILGITEYLDRKPKALSGGQRQRVALGRAIVRDPKVFLMDEPLSNLDAKLRVQMRTAIKKLQRRLGITTIYVTHDQEEALSMSDTVVVMNNGEIQQIGSPTDIYNEPENRFVAGFIGESNIIEGTMIKDFLVEFDGFQFECVDKGFEDNEAIEVVLRPEDLDIVEPDQAKIRGTVRNITFKGVHYEILIETELRTYMVHTTDYAEVGREVGLKFGPEDIHVMCRMGGY